MADSITHISESGPHDTSGMRMFMIVVVVMAVVALGIFVYYMVKGTGVSNPPDNSQVVTPAPATEPGSINY